MTDKLSRAQELISRSSNIVVLTGAGVSAPSGIPTFRGVDGLWRHREPVDRQQFDASPDARVEYWESKLETWEAFRRAAPNPAHYAIVDLERAGRLRGVLTQNVDGLHHRAGTSPHRLVELHGTNLRTRCNDCCADVATDVPMALFAQTHQVPVCDVCGGPMRPDVVMFGEMLAIEAVARARVALDRADLVLVVGTTLTVAPASSWVRSAAQRGVPVIIVNDGPTCGDDIAACLVSGCAAELLPGLCEAQ